MSVSASPAFAAIRNLGESADNVTILFKLGYPDDGGNLQ